MENRDLEIIQNRIGYTFKNLDLLQQAFVRKSYARENGGADNEVLEFIGDKVLDIVIVRLLTDKYGYYCHDCDDFDKENDFDEFCCEKNEGQLTSLKKSLVEKKTLASVAESLELNNYLIMGKGDKRNGIQNEASVMEDLFEAIIGAITLDCDWDWDEITGAIDYMLQPEDRLENDDEDNYIELIQEWSLRNSGELPDIHTAHSSYYDELSGLRRANEIRSTTKGDKNVFVINVQEYPRTHFYSELRLDGIDKIFVGYGRSKNGARKDVCKLAYHYLEENDLLYTIRDEIENPNKDEAISQLEILARRGYFSIPTYEFEQMHDENGNPVWTAECHIEEYDTYFDAVSSSKKVAKKTAAFEMLQFVLNEEED
ncbi:MAG: hypothetical protein IKZ59_04365 [Clostridia bacterium]|nr:hypothetical protein [Clostridia bacterium]